MLSPKVYEPLKDINENACKPAVPYVFGNKLNSSVDDSSKNIEAVATKFSLLILKQESVDSNPESPFSCTQSPAFHTSSVLTPGLFSSPLQESTSRCTSHSNSDKLWKKYFHNVQKQRRFGSSDIETLSSKKLLSKISKTKRKSKRSFKIFSTCVTPYVSPKKRRMIENHIYRLSGISMSPSTPIAWLNQSPIEVKNSPKQPFFSLNESLTKPEPILCPNSGDKVIPEASPISKGLQISGDSCPIDKLYFWQDDVSELITDDKLGRGGFGQVFTGTYRGTKVAIKKMKNEFRHKKAVFENFLGEFFSLRLSHPNLVRSLVMVQPPNSPLTPGSSKDTTYLIMEYAGSQNLLKLVNNTKETISDERRCGFCCDILRGLSYLHDYGLAHLDLKPGNIIVTEAGSCKICDFGSCKLVQSAQAHVSNDELSRLSSISGCSDSISPPADDSGLVHHTAALKPESLLMGTLIYRAPELLRGLQPTVKADVFSFGVSAWQIWQRSSPYPGLHQHTAVFTIVAYNKRPKMPDREDCSEFDKNFSELIQSCWAGDVNLRPSSQEALEKMERLAVKL